MYLSCATCALLDKSRKKQSEKNLNCYLYGCNKREGGHVVGWCREDKELKYQGCSDFKPLTAEAHKQHNPTPKPTPKPTRPESVQLSIFDLI